MLNNRPAAVFLGCLLLGGILALFPGAPVAVVSVLAFIVVAPVLALGIFVVLNGLPASAKAEADTGGLGRWWMVVALTIAAVLLFTQLPELDMAVARRFFIAPHSFVGVTALGNFGRAVGNVFPFVLLVAFVVAYLAKRRGWAVPYAPRGREVLFLVLTMAIGPGLIVNLGMKDHLHRPRPVHVAEFGGGKDFRPFYRFDGACAKNCSFPSGEGAEAFWMLAPASLAPPPWRATALVGAVVYGGLVSLLRLAFGGHFLSDVVFSALIMWGLVLAFRRWFFRRASN